MSNEDLRCYVDKLRKNEPTGNLYFHKNYENKLKFASMLYSLKVTEEVISARCQSGEITNSNVIIHEDVQKASNDKSDYKGVTTGAEVSLPMDDFFQRPVLLKKFSLAPLATTLNTLDPWLVWSNDQTVRTKLAHYTYFRGDLKIRVIMSSSKFHYGTMLVSNQPFPLENGNLITTEHFFSGANLHKHELFGNYLSQSKEVAYCRIGVDDAIELSIPFLAPKPYLRLFRTATPNSVITSVNALEDFKDLTKLYFLPLNPIKCANDDHNAAVEFEVYGWVENVSLGPITSTDMTITAQSGQIDVKMLEGLLEKAVKVKKEGVKSTIEDAGKELVNDEYANAGPATQVASAVANISNSLSGVPMIGGVAKATSMIAGKAAKIANLFGFSRPIKLDEAKHVKLFPSSNMSFTSGFDLSQRLTLDPKQELALRLPGHDETPDEMSLPYLCARESFIQTIDWSDTDIGRNTCLASIPINPLMGTSFPGNIDVGLPSPLGFVAHNFTYWRGDITFRIEVVASQFHRGKLMIIFEPNSFQNGLLCPKETQMNQQYTYYMDLEKQRDVSITVGYVGDTPFKKIPNHFHRKSDDGDTYSLDDSDAYYTGNLVIKPLTKLVSPSISNSNNVVGINVYVHSKNMSFAGPKIQVDDTYQITVQSGVLSAEQQIAAQETSASGESLKVTDVLINKTSPQLDDIYLHHFGERIDSFRSLFKRAFSVGMYKFTKTNAATGDSNLTMRSNIYPPFIEPNILVGAVTQPVPVLNETDLNTHSRHQKSIFQNVRLGFLLMRGSMRHKLVCSSPIATETSNFNYGRTFVYHNFGDDVSGANGYFAPTKFQNISDASYGITDSGSALAVFDGEQNRIYEFEIPFYSQFSCIPAHTVHYSSDGYFLKSCEKNVNNFEVRMYLGNMQLNDKFVINHLCSIGEDFSFHRFQGAAIIDLTGPLQDSNTAAPSITT